MANHKSAAKRIRQNAKRRLQNRYYKKSARSAIKKLRHMSESAEAGSFLGKVVQMIDKLSKSNKAANLKGKLTRFVNGLAK